mgnify:CR=1 FL=1
MLLMLLEHISYVVDVIGVHCGLERERGGVDFFVEVRLGAVWLWGRGGGGKTKEIDEKTTKKLADNTQGLITITNKAQASRICSTASHHSSVGKRRKFR